MAVKWYFFLRVLYASGISLINPILDGITLAHLQSEGSSKSDFGKERLHGAIWWAIANIIIGICIDIWGFNIMYAATLATFLLSIMALVGYAREQNNNYFLGQANGEGENHMLVPGEEIQDYRSVPISVAVEQHVTEIEHTSETTDGVDSSLSTVELFVLIFGSFYGFGLVVSCVTLTMGTAVVENLIFLFFEKLGASWTVCGLSVLVTVMFEVPIFHFAPDLLQLLGVSRLQHIACLAYVTRVVGYTLIPSNHSYWVLFLEPLHGVTFACYRTASVEFVAQLSPDGFEASGQGLLSTLKGCIGAFTGLSIGGYVEQQFGARVMYRGLAIVVALGTLVFDIAGRYKPPHRPHLPS
uniref:Major facilitator superfamily associated domain-containing protein n=1 Tax=Leptocylindrus danicus TaxID=163516 RepID=A0A7S2KQ61_9STRA